MTSSAGLRATVVGTGALAVSLGVGAVLALVAAQQWTTVTSPAPTQPADILMGVLAAAGAIAAVWLGLGIVVSALAALPGAWGRLARPVARRVAPAALRRGVTLVVSGALVAGVSPLAAHAAGGEVPSSSTRTVTTAPASPGSAPSPDFLPTAPTPRPPAARVHVVVRGDTLWDLASAQLGGHASDGQIAAQWHQWWSANRTVIGADPDLIEPGQTLVVPGLPST